MDLTMRQVYCLSKTIHIRSTKKRYYEFAFHAQLHKAEIAPLEEFLGVGLDDEKPFDEQTDRKLNEHAQKLLNERRALANGRR